MDFRNLTPYPADLFRMYINEELIGASLLTRVTYDLKDEGLRIRDEQEPWIVSAVPWASPRGVMESDLVFYKGGVDIFLFGEAQALEGRAVGSLDVVLDVGTSFRRCVRVFGDRHWKRTLTGLSISDPEPFTTMSLTIDRAYGGKGVWDGLEIPWLDNPSGVGFYLYESAAAGQPLPNLEDPKHLIKRWDDRPQTVGLGLCPLPNFQRLSDGLVVDESRGLKGIKPTLFNAAFPAMIGPQISEAERICIRGVSRRGPIEFKVPPCPVVGRLQFGDQCHDVSLKIDQIGIEADVARVFLTYRYPFRYKFIPMQRRSCDLLSRAAQL